MMNLVDVRIFAIVFGPSSSAGLLQLPGISCFFSEE